MTVPAKICHCRGNAQPPGFPVKRVDHPRREVDVDPALLQTGAADRSEVQVSGYVFAVIKPLVEFLSPQRVLPPPSGTGGQG
jgi:hypothetical protein